jgi:hypothetical protein
MWSRTNWGGRKNEQAVEEHGIYNTGRCPNWKHLFSNYYTRSVQFFQNFPEIYKLHQHSKCQRGEMRQVPYREATNIRGHRKCFNNNNNNNNNNYYYY